MIEGLDKLYLRKKLWIMDLKDDGGYQKSLFIYEILSTDKGDSYENYELSDELMTALVKDLDVHHTIDNNQYWSHNEFIATSDGLVIVRSHYGYWEEHNGQIESL